MQVPNVADQNRSNATDAPRPAHHTAADERGDAELVELARRDANATAYRELVRRHERGVHAVALSLLHDATESEDMAQEAFLRAFRNLDLLADPARFGPWVRRIAFGVCIDWLRAFRPELYCSLDRPRDDQDDDPRTAAPPTPVRDDAPLPLESTVQRDLADRVVAALGKLPERYRVPFTLYHIDGLSHARVAAALGVPEGTVRSLVTRARRRMAALLAADAPAPRAAGADTTPERGGTRQSRRTRGHAATARPASAPHTTEGDIFDPDTDRRLLHITNGDSAAGTMRSGVAGDVIAWPDILHEGPILPDIDDATWRAARVRFLADTFQLSYDETLRRYESMDRALERYAEYDEVVLWFEHDLFDQLLIIRHLEWFARRDLGRTALSLICIGEFPGVQPFHGLGQLSSHQLASLLGTRRPVTLRQTELGRVAWRAFSGEDPTRVERLLRGNTDALPFLAAALRRYLEEFPATDTGLPRAEREILQSLSSTPMSLHALFRAMQQQETAGVFMGDASFWQRVRALASGERPLVTVDAAEASGPDLPRGTATITDVGRAVLTGHEDWIHLSGFDRWLGGSHLVAPAGGDVQWRWDAASARIVERERA